MKSTIKAVLFDLDDTLWAIDPVIARAEQVLFEWLKRHTPAVASDSFIETFRTRQKRLIEQHPRYGYALWELRHACLVEAFEEAGIKSTAADDAMQVFSRARNDVHLYDDVIPALASLGHRYMIGSISNGAADLEHIGIAHHFRISLVASAFGRPKPEPAIFHAACDALEIHPGQAVYVGDDAENDVAGAMRAGMKTAWMKRPDLVPKKALPENVRPDIIVHSLGDLEKLLMP
ncbi:HAD family hydrolase [Oxalobacter vibrioformis]|uniref:HAD family hydrolase n=1 Tax=Oxalobacter vibrioformis TaxID=933080 RepID=A0A9E9P2H9_9BURK|nr:HAD family hydrolase [Oxalobacter vibrioformis]WAW09240.1 HAD family hydrolase [Oxalobacter vibrioformis]